MISGSEMVGPPSNTNSHPMTLVRNSTACSRSGTVIPICSLPCRPGKPTVLAAFFIDPVRIFDELTSDAVELLGPLHMRHVAGRLDHMDGDIAGQSLGLRGRDHLVGCAPDDGDRYFQAGETGPHAACL